ncbi:MAG: AMP-binding protein, partial [Bradyrhizobium sp.]|uniref:AMP-binding protein n=1 Tax=Bradyrhizobium sp. TaxID=376 RepID=UPI00290099E9
MRSLDCVVQGNDDLTLEIVRHLHESGHAVTVLITQNPRCLAFAHTARIRSAPSRPSALGGYDLAVHADGLADGVPDLPPGTLVLRPLQRDGDGPAVLVAAIASQRSSFEIAWMDGQRVLWTASVPLSARDTAGTVVERAHRAALDGLTELVTMLAREEELADTPPPVTTPVETATLRAVHRLHFDIDAATLSALPRAIDFGSHRARCALRLVAGGVGLTVGQIDIAESSETTPGQVLAVSMDSVVIAARNGSVRLGGLHDADGRALDRTAIAALFAVGQTVDGAPPDATVLRRVQAAEAQWTTAIAAIEPARLDFLATLTRNIQPANGTADSCIRQTAVGLPNIGDDRFKPPALSSLVAAVVATAARALDATTVSLALRLPIRPDPFAARLVPLTLAASADRGFAELCADSEVLLSLALSEPMAADLPQRLGRTDWSEQVPVAILTGDGSAPSTPLRLRVTLAPGQTNTVQAAALEWSAASLEPAFVAELADSIATVWNAGCADPDTQLGDLPLLSAEAHAALRASSKGSDVATARDLTLNALLHTAALTYGERPAVSFNAIGLDYTTLHAHVRVLARQIRARTRAHGDHVTVALMFERGIAMVVALLATLEAGAAYLPLDPRDPRPRIAQMIEDAAPVLVLVGAEFEDHLCAGIDQLTVDPLGAAAGPE